ncbi:MAG: hypothetical protein A49_05700 [Methyloceanibacter sp.]|nr:MAG: hypothetical protein A49_05700 [Methyloceanibacter sp.]
MLYNFLRRLTDFKEAIQRQLANQAKLIKRLSRELASLRRNSEHLQQQFCDLQTQLDELKVKQNHLAEVLGQLLYIEIHEDNDALDSSLKGVNLCFARRGETVRILSIPRGAPCPPWLGSESTDEIVDLVLSGDVTRFECADLLDSNRTSQWRNLNDIVGRIRRYPSLYRDALSSALPGIEVWKPGSESLRCQECYDAGATAVTENLELLDFVALGSTGKMGAHYSGEAQAPAPPFDKPERLSEARAHAAPKQRSAVLLGNCYYNFKFLAQGLRQRGWDAVSVSLEAPDSTDRQFLHGADISLGDSDLVKKEASVREFFDTIPERFGTLMFYGRGCPTFFDGNVELAPRSKKLPYDLLELKRHSVLIGYTVNGCVDLALKSSIRAVTGGLCGKCPWDFHEEICSDKLNAAWAAKLDLVCDWVALDGDWVTPEREGPKFTHLPVVTAMCPQFWHPDISIPAEHLIDREHGELVVLHAVGNNETRKRHERDIKGTGAIFDAVDRLRSDGIKVKLAFATNVPSTQMRYQQVQADIIVDQLNYGRFGAFAREALMLGRPLVTCLKNDGLQPSPQYVDPPAVHATEATVYEVLKGLLQDNERRTVLSREARKYTVKWHDLNACAARFEEIVDRIRSGQTPAEAERHVAQLNFAPEEVHTLSQPLSSNARSRRS